MYIFYFLPTFLVAVAHCRVRPSVGLPARLSRFCVTSSKFFHHLLAQAFWFYVN